MMKKDFLIHEMMYHADNEEYEEGQKNALPYRLTL